MDTAAACFAELGLAPAEHVCSGDWSASAEEPLQLDEATLCRLADELAFPETLTAALIRSAHSLSPAVRRLMQHCVYLLRSNADSGQLYFLPHNDAGLGDPLLNALILLQLVDELRARHAQAGIPADVTQATLADILLWLEDYRQKHGHYGMAQAGWLQRHLRMGLFKLGRLQFEHAKLHDPIRVYRARSGDAVLIALTAGQQICSDGRFASANSHGQEPVETSFMDDDHQITAHVCDVAGRFSHVPQTFSRSDYELGLEQGDCVLSVHIDASGPMDIAACLESFARAMPFYRKYFPELQPQAFYCSSWLLDAAFQQYLKPESNIIGFQKLWHLFARPRTGDGEFFVRVWGKNKSELDLQALEPKTSLQHAVLSHISNGGRWNDAGGLLFEDELS